MNAAYVQILSDLKRFSQRGRLILVATGASLFATGLGFPAAAAQSSSDSAIAALRAGLPATLAAAKARADSAASRVDTIVVSPTELSLMVGDSVYSHDLWSRLTLVGLTGTGDTVRAFAHTFAVEPNRCLEQRRGDFIARCPGTATLWIYLGSADPQRLFRDATRTTRVSIRIR